MWRYKQEGRQEIKMGDPRKLRKKYNTPMHPWQGQRIKEENEILKQYGLKNKRKYGKQSHY